VLSNKRSTNKPTRSTWDTEAERIHAEEAAERGDATKSKRPWWKFWA
jgi:hypothetical protein